MKIRKKQVFVVTGGGTGGHIYPALAIAKGLQKRFAEAEVHYIGSHRGLEKDIVPREGLPFLTVHCRGLERKVSLQALLSLGEMTLGIAESLNHLRKIKPQVLIGTGGFVALPVVMAATLLGIPTVIHEQNAYPGITNRILAPRVNKVLLTFAEAEKRLKSRQSLLTGLPVRPQILSATKAEGRKFFDLPEDALVLLVVGGSRGAQRLNEAMPAVTKAWTNHKQCHIIHVTGQSNYELTLERYRQAGIEPDKARNLTVVSYLDRMDLALVVSDLCVGRAGAAFISELTVCGLPSLLIPYPYAAENHQEANARSLELVGAAELILDKDLNGEVLNSKIKNLFDNPEKRTAMAKAAKEIGQPHALERILDEIEKIL
ncbi:undecaprenyldiphospho-muramoylpentapeptide beta-N-acetylglucosaminyltransferase [Heliorestis acidaminivorans]|uniref:UDP-N-acetylglucosamine--N-acetylmuramyl-(pentapeptide) pyrophosphoryl-undecaprenol N-acetylglucosamine transferase n=1 Tax=Heliorestis acidaminivorans TaxID=553427 RepID=A0A6I0F4T1_9FIRM|nr:undecaprenyldiphospho-muramoylpentapeptide beta-N-acetylglucosaminyltransferase [Heliorestis acidaminivorans]KAB2954523.1 undecaprenyldiphospho-muramoylpentapeptide beta-N-acetylglucosaminyltransferase [Heliorestis acidaminivorans]